MRRAPRETSSSFLKLDRMEDKMTKAAMYDEVGGPEVLYVGDVELGDLGEGEVRVRVEAAGINPFDSKVISGFIPIEAPFPRRVGSDFAGTVEQVSEGATYWDGTPVEVGDPVLGRASDSVATHAVASASGITRRPEGLPVEVAGGLNVAGLTAVSCLEDVPVSEGDTLLVGGATGAVGMVVCQLAAARGAKVIGTGSASNAEFLKSIGVIPVEYGEGLIERVKEHGPITAVVDCHGREALDAGLALGVAPERMTGTAAYGAAKELGVKPVTHEHRTPGNLASLAEKIVEGDLVIPVAAQFSLDDVEGAFELLNSSHTPGKIVVIP